LCRRSLTLSGFVVALSENFSRAASAPSRTPHLASPTHPPLDTRPERVRPSDRRPFRILRLAGDDIVTPRSPATRQHTMHQLRAPSPRHPSKYSVSRCFDLGSISMRLVPRLAAASSVRLRTDAGTDTDIARILLPTRVRPIHSVSAARRKS